MLRRFSSNRFRFSDGFKSGEKRSPELGSAPLSRLSGLLPSVPGFLRPPPAPLPRAFARPAFVRGGFPPPEVPGSFSRSRLLFRFVAVQLVHVRYLDGLL